MPHHHPPASGSKPSFLESLFPGWQQGEVLQAMKHSFPLCTLRSNAENASKGEWSVQLHNPCGFGCPLAGLLCHHSTLGIHIVYIDLVPGRLHQAASPLSEQTCHRDSKK